MRYKFRAWDTVQDRMLPVETIYFRGNIITLDEGDNSVSDSSEMFILMQYTGLTDRNGKEIYEGDILRMEDGVKDQFVKWSNWMAGWVMVISDDSGSTDIPTTCEVIGNIYENPELKGE